MLEYTREEFIRIRDSRNGWRAACLVACSMLVLWLTSYIADQPPAGTVTLTVTPPGCACVGMECSPCGEGGK